MINLSKDWTNDETGEVRVDDLNEHIHALIDLRAEYEQDGQSIPGKEAEELRLLTGFRAAVRKTVGEFDDGTVIVPDDRFEDYVRYAAEYEYGISAENVGDYVDWERYAQDRKGEFLRLELDGQAVWVKAS